MIIGLRPGEDLGDDPRGDPYADPPRDEPYADLPRDEPYDDPPRDEPVVRIAARGVPCTRLPIGFLGLANILLLIP